MGLVNVKVILKNPREKDLKALEVDALADSGGCTSLHPRTYKNTVET